MAIVRISHQLSDLRDTVICACEKLIGVFHTGAENIINGRNVLIFLKKRVKIAAADKAGLSQLVNGHVAVFTVNNIKTAFEKLVCYLLSLDQIQRSKGQNTAYSSNDYHSAVAALGESVNGVLKELRNRLNVVNVTEDYLLFTVSATGEIVYMMLVIGGAPIKFKVISLCQNSDRAGRGNDYKIPRFKRLSAAIHNSVGNEKHHPSLHGNGHIVVLREDVLTHSIRSIFAVVKEGIADNILIKFTAVRLWPEDVGAVGGYPVLMEKCLIKLTFSIRRSPFL